MGNDIQKETKLQGKEKLSYWIYFFGQNIFYGLVAINMQTFFSDVGITVTAIAVIMFFTKLWDAVNDPLLGIIVDKVHFKSGRFLPWLRISLPLLAISSVFLFFLPGQASPVVKIAWATIAYVAWSMSYTLCDVPIFVLPTSMTNNIAERSQLLTTGRFFAMVGIVGTATLLPMLTGEVPFRGEAMVDVAIKHIREELLSLREYGLEIPVSVEQIICRCCQKSPNRRYQSMQELIKDLKHSLISLDKDFVKAGFRREDICGNDRGYGSNKKSIGQNGNKEFYQNKR